MVIFEVRAIFQPVQLSEGAEISSVYKTKRRFMIEWNLELFNAFDRVKSW